MFQLFVFQNIRLSISVMFPDTLVEIVVGHKGDKVLNYCMFNPNSIIKRFPKTTNKHISIH